MRAAGMEQWQATGMLDLIRDGEFHGPMSRPTADFADLAGRSPRKAKDWLRDHAQAFR
jgi:hypothetical protein